MMRSDSGEGPARLDEIAERAELDDQDALLSGQPLAPA